MSSIAFVGQTCSGLFFQNVPSIDQKSRMMYFGAQYLLLLWYYSSLILLMLWIGCIFVWMTGSYSDLVARR